MYTNVCVNALIYIEIALSYNNYSYAFSFIMSWLLITIYIY